MGALRALCTLPGPGRFGYSGILDRPDYSWPAGKRLAVYFAINLEHFAFGRGLGARIGGPAAEGAPDVLNWSWREYGNRVGGWRLLELFEELELPVSLVANSSCLDHCPELVDRFLAGGAELVAHGRTNSEAQGCLSAEQECELIQRSVDAIQRHTGARPGGWLGPWISESTRTPDLLAAAGFDYCLDWCHDDQPTWMAVGGNGKLLAVPYQQELNDIPHLVSRLGGSAEFANDIIDGFDELLSQSAGQPLVLGLPLHSYLVGQPHRLRQLRRVLRHIKSEAERTGRVWFTQPGRVAQHCAGLPSGTLLEPT